MLTKKHGNDKVVACSSQEFEIVLTNRFHALGNIDCENASIENRRVVKVEKPSVKIDNTVQYCHCHFTIGYCFLFLYL